jgi:hypothetical protein
MPALKSVTTKSRRRKWRPILFSLLILILVVAFSLQTLKQALISIVVYREHIFTPPAQLWEKPWMARVKEKATFFWDLAALRIAREKRLKLFNPVIKPMIQVLNQREAAGEDITYSMHIYREIRWRLNFTADTAATRIRIDDLRNSLSAATNQKDASSQLPSDGSWGAGISAWYLRLYYSSDQIVDSLTPRFPFTFLDRINSPSGLKAVLDSAVFDSFTRTGGFNREQLDETFSAIARLLHKKKPIAYTFHPQLLNALSDYVSRWQNPVTGCWGQWMVDRQGNVWKMDDMGITFHVISDFQGDVPHKDLIAKRLLQLDNVDFPAGITFNEHYENHLNWDAVKIFRYAWPDLDSATKKKVRSEISRLLTWCLTQSCQPDGSFKISELDDTMGDAYRYGVAFLCETGYFDPKLKYWTDEIFPQANVVYRRIESKLQSIGLNSSGVRDAYETLHGKSF